MSYLYYCKSCNSLKLGSADGASIACPKCGRQYYPLHLTDSDWEDMSNDEKRAALSKAVSSAPLPVKAAPPSKKTDYNPNYDKTSGLSVTAFILSMLGCTSIVGLILGIIDLAKGDGRKKGLSIAAVVISGLVLIMSAIYAGSSASGKNELKTADTADRTNELTVDLSSDDDTSASSNTSSGKKSASYNRSDNSSANVPTISEQVLVDQNGVKITAVEYVSDSIWGDGIKLLLENNTSYNLMYSCEALIVNDYMINDLFADSVAAGKSSYSTLYLSNSQLREAGIDNVGKIEMYFRIYDDDSWEDLFTTGCITLKTSDYSGMDSTVNDTGIELYNRNNIRIMARYVDEDSIWGKAILLYVENNGSRNVTITVDDLSVNGFMITPVYSDTVYAGKKSIDDITLFSSELEENGISRVDNVELKFNIYEADTFTTIDKTEAISFDAD